MSQLRPNDDDEAFARGHEEYAREQQRKAERDAQPARAKKTQKVTQRHVDKHSRRGKNILAVQSAQRKSKSRKALHSALQPSGRAQLHKDAVELGLYVVTERASDADRLTMMRGDDEKR